MNMHCNTIYLIEANYQTPHICLTKVLHNTNDKKYIKIKTQKSFLSISSWI